MRNSRQMYIWNEPTDIGCALLLFTAYELIVLVQEFQVLMNELL